MPRPRSLSLRKQAFALTQPIRPRVSTAKREVWNAREADAMAQYCWCVPCWQQSRLTEMWEATWLPATATRGTEGVPC
jgi:hypothetical protein